MRTLDPSPAVEVRRLESSAEQRSAAELYRSVFGYADQAFAVSPRLLRALLDNGGTALGAFTRTGEILGFCYGFSAVRDGVTFHYSQATVVAALAQGAGIGRKLKTAQAEEARRTGARAMRWTFDPRLERNAVFNLNRLGARGIRFLPDYYGEPGTDRMLVEWPLDEETVAGNRRVAERLHDLVDDPDALRRRALVLAPLDAPGDGLRQAFETRLQAVACLRRCDTAVYVFGRTPDGA